MFTGIVESVGEIKKIDRSEQGVGFSIETNLDRPKKLKIGDSVAVGGACLTVTARHGSEIDVFVSNRSLSDTRFSDLQVGESVNIETALTLNDPLGGHLVTGHVDGLAKCIGHTFSGASVLLEFSVDRQLKINQFIVPQGSISLDGVSLTVKDVADKKGVSEFAVNIIPHTLEMTTLKGVAAGDFVHVEVDMLARYAGRITDYLAVMRGDPR
ncbi:MAG: riboflavin synthase [Acidiferrobacterales bacterium]|nr:riboflavin synthase [Acidiferrobacterales bacterium]